MEHTRRSGRFDRLDAGIARFMHRFGHPLHRWSLGLFFLWMGLLKQFGQKTGSSLLADTIYFGDPSAMVQVLGWWEAAIGVCLLATPLVRLALLLMLIRLPGTLLALVLKHEVCFEHIPFVPTPQGQYLIKDFFLFSAGMVIGAVVREDGMSECPEAGSDGAAGKGVDSPG
ncbi:MAG: hypothetical protein ACTS3F_08620 [Phycisphaerales bacterium]